MDESTEQVETTESDVKRQDDGEAKGEQCDRFDGYRTPLGRFRKGGPGGPGRKRRTEYDARSNYSKVRRWVIDCALNGGRKWLDWLRDNDPAKFATVFTTFTTEERKRDNEDSCPRCDLMPSDQDAAKIIKEWQTESQDLVSRLYARIETLEGENKQTKDELKTALEKVQDTRTPRDESGQPRDTGESENSVQIGRLRYIRGVGIA